MKKTTTMRYLIFLGFMSIFTCFNAQLMGGNLVEDERKMLGAYDFKVEDVNEGTLVFELAVNRLGKVTSARLIQNGTTVSSTPTRMKVKNELLLLKFEEGMYFPEFHHVILKVTTVKSELK